MKKIKILGIITAAVIFAALAVFAVFAAAGIIEIKPAENGKPAEIIFTPAKSEEEKALEWQTSETSEDVIAVLHTEEGKIKIKLADCKAAEKFTELENSEFITLAENMFIQTAVKGENFETEETPYGCFYGAVGFVMEDEKAAPSFFIITAKELSGLSKAYLSGASISEERKALYEEKGGIPEYEGKVVIFGQVIFGMETAEKIAAKENFGYTGGYAAAEPVKITKTEIISPSETEISD